MYSDRGEGKCPHCGATIKVSEYRMGVPGGKEREEAVCPICKTVGLTYLLFLRNIW